MVTLEVFLIGLLIISVFTSLVTEAVKKILAEHSIKYHANTLAGVIALVLSAAIGVGYAIVSDAGFTPQVVICIIALIFMGWLSAMVGYDKVIQAISQFKTSTKVE